MTMMRCSILAMVILASPVTASAGESKLLSVEKRYADGSSVLMTCGQLPGDVCALEVSLEGIPARYTVDFGRIGEVPTLEHIALLNHSANPYGGTLVVSVECLGRAEKRFTIESAHSVQCLKYIYLSGFHAIAWGATLVMGRMEPVEVN